MKLRDWHRICGHELDDTSAKQSLHGTHKYSLFVVPNPGVCDQLFLFAAFTDEIAPKLAERLDSGGHFFGAKLNGQHLLSFPTVCT